jgi:hypothetical protein
VSTKKAPAPKRIVAGAAQLEAEVGDVATNLERIERLVNEADRGDERDSYGGDFGALDAVDVQSHFSNRIASSLPW